MTEHEIPRPTHQFLLVAQGGLHLCRAPCPHRGGMAERRTSLKKRCQEGILLVAFDEIDAKCQ
jgi:hypothetical protein